MSADGVRYGWTQETLGAVVTRMITRAATYRSFDDFELYGPAREEDMLLALLTLQMLGGDVGLLDSRVLDNDYVTLNVDGETLRVPRETMLTYTMDGKVTIDADLVRRLRASSMLGDERERSLKAELAQSRVWTRHYAAAERA